MSLHSSLYISKKKTHNSNNSINVNVDPGCGYTGFSLLYELRTNVLWKPGPSEQTCSVRENWPPSHDGHTDEVETSAIIGTEVIFPMATIYYFTQHVLHCME
jgi:hypothetical protein